MANPFANAPHFTGNLSGAYLFGVQTGQNTSLNGGVDQMKYITLDQLTSYVRGTFGNLWNYRGEYSSALPTNLAVNDYFLATGDFTSGGISFENGHMYAWNGSTWSDITDTLAQYALASDVTAIDDRLQVAEAQITAFSGGIVPKGEVATEADLPTASASNKGWMYYVISVSKYKISDGTQWVDFGSYPIQSYALRSSFPASGAERILYIAYDEAKIYYWNGTSYVSEIDDLLDGTKTAKKAEHDASGNVITTTYATKTELQTELQTEQTARQNADTNLQNQINKNAKQIENLNQQFGDYNSTRYQNKPYGVVPTGMAKNGLWATQRGVTRAWNQLVQNGNFVNSTGWSYNNGSGSSVSDNTYTLTISSTPSTVYATRIHQTTDYFSFVTNHVYCVRAKIKLSYASTVSIGRTNGDLVTASLSADTETLVSGIVTATSSGALWICVDRDMASTTNDTAEVSEVCIYDLTLLGASDTSSVSSVLAQFPQLGQYNSYDEGSLVSNTISGLTSKSRNIWDEEWLNGYYNASNGVYSSDARFVCCKNKIPVQPFQTYYIKTPVRLEVVGFDADENYVALVNGNIVDTTITIPVGVYYITFGSKSSNELTTYDPDTKPICINLSDSNNGTYTPYWSRTIPLPSPWTGRSAGTVYDTLEPNVEVDGVAKRRDTQNVGNTLMTDLAWSGSSGIFTVASFNGRAYASDNYNITCSKYSTYTTQNSTGSNITTIASSNDKVITLNGGSSTIYAIDSSCPSLEDFISAITGHYLTYELATPVVTLSDPVDNAIRTEADGTVTPNQTQEHQIDVDFDMDFIAIGA